MRDILETGNATHALGARGRSQALLPSKWSEARVRLAEPATLTPPFRARRQTVYPMRNFEPDGMKEGGKQWIRSGGISPW
jgi:hypothetical protein